MDNYNNNNYNNDNSNGYNSYGSQYGYTQNNQQNYNGYYGSYQDYSNVNEVVYTPKKKKNGGRKVLAGIVGVLTVAAIGATSIVGYNLIRGEGSVGTSDNSSTDKSVKTSASASTSNDTDSKSDTVERDMPSITQLASPADAMSIPEIVEKNTASVVGIQCVATNGVFMGTGIIMSEDGYILTNAHVVENARSVSVKLPSSYADDSESDDSDLTISAQIIGTDAQSDIAVLKIDKTGLTKAEFGKSSDVKVGEVAIVIGNPLSMELANSVTAGIISSLNRTITIEDRTMNYIQTDASINSGNSGGPLINAYGQVIGIASAAVTKSYGEGIGFAIPIDEAIPIIEDLIKNGHVTGRPTLGVSGENITDIYSRYYNIPKGFRIKVVNSGSAAEEAGIKVNDIIIGIEGKLVESIEEFNAVKNQHKAGETVKISVYRNGEILDFDVTLKEAANEAESAEQQTQTNEYDPYNDYREFFNQFPF
ncbi:MAG: trypsin-like peptidase domain-containing protein [Ruminococcus sp.]|nr:trypsin-like peptidase domain-containing protein [Ruminococcus sp.]